MGDGSLLMQLGSLVTIASLAPANFYHFIPTPGDGSLLMQLGSLVTIASLAPANFYHFIFFNGLYQSSGNQLISTTSSSSMAFIKAQVIRLSQATARWTSASWH